MSLLAIVSLDVLFFELRKNGLLKLISFGKKFNIKDEVKDTANMLHYTHRIYLNNFILKPLVITKKSKFFS